MNAEKSIGENESERRLAALCSKTFLSMWSYPNVFKNTNQRGNSNSIGQEICDLLVIFDDVVVIFSDKNCEFKSTGNISVDWARWYRKSIETPARTAYGAQKWITRHPEQIFVDKYCRIKIPVPIPTNPRFLKIVVAHSAGEACKKYYGGDGSLAVNTALREDDHLGFPFFTGRILSDDSGFVHILDDVTLEAMLESLDTVKDFTKYFFRKERALSDGAEIIAESELDILAHHLMSPEGQSDDPFSSDTDFIQIVPNAWNDFSSSETWLYKQLVDRESYYWDKLIEDFHKFHPENIEPFPNSNFSKDIEPAIRYLASTTRFERRMLTKQFSEIIKNGVGGEAAGFRTSFSPNGETPHFVFGVLPFDHTYGSHDEYRKYRFALLMQTVIRQGYAINDGNLIIGIATESGVNRYVSHDLAAIRYDESWREVGEKLYHEYMLEDRKPLAYRINDDQFPRGPEKREELTLRGKCMCGSGKLFRDCCINKFNLPKEYLK